MNIHEAGHNPNLKDASYPSDVLEGDRLRVATRLARSEYVVEFFFVAASVLSKWVLSTTEKLVLVRLPASHG